MSTYECTFLHAKDNKEGPKKIEALLEQLKAEVKVREDWGVKHLAYPIRKLTEAKYLHVQIELEPAGIKQLEEKLRLEEDLLRYLVVRG